jgi:hypothetical protein
VETGARCLDSVDAVFLAYLRTGIRDRFPWNSDGQQQQQHASGAAVMPLPDLETE